MMSAVSEMPQMYLAMEDALMPLLRRTMQQDASDFFEDTLEVPPTLNSTHHAHTTHTTYRPRHS